MADPTRMEEYYKILHHLKGFKVDRQYPYSFESKTNVLPVTVELVEVEGRAHANLLRFTDVDGAIIIPTITRGYTDIDSVELKLTPVSDDLDPTKVELQFHDTLNADVPLLSILGTGEIIPQGTVGAVNFQINDQSADPESSVLVGVKSISIHTTPILAGVDVSDLVLRSSSPICTLEEVEKTLLVGEKYITDSVDVETVPDSLLEYKYMAGAALLWLGKWEHEGQVMSDGTSDSKNYADRLLGIVNRAINNYGYSSEGDDSEGGINEDLVGSSLI